MINVQDVLLVGIYAREIVSRCVQMLLTHYILW